MKPLRLLPIWLLLSFGAHADTVALAVAANFSAPMKQIAANFERASGHQLLISYGATGKLYAQIKNGAPFELLLAADSKTPARLIKENAAVAGSQFGYAVGTLVLWSRQPGLVDAHGQILKNANFERLALANPELAPYGTAAQQSLQALGLYDALKPKFVTGENIAQTWQFVSSGNAALGFVALSQVLAAGQDQGSMWLLPSNLYAPIRQDGVVLGPGQGKPAVAALVNYLQSDAAKAIIKSFGYQLP